MAVPFMCDGCGEQIAPGESYVCWGIPTNGNTRPPLGYTHLKADCQLAFWRDRTAS